MILKLIVDQANLYADKKIDFSVARRYFNEGVDMLSNLYDTAGIIKNVAFEATRGNKTLIVDGLLKVLEVLKGGFLYYLYYYENGKIVFENEGIYEVKYLKRLDRAGLESSDILLDQSYCFAISKYIAARELLSKDPTSRKGIDLLNEFQEQSKAVHNRLKFSKKPFKKMKVPLWR